MSEKIITGSNKREEKKIILEKLSYTNKPKTRTHKRRKENDIRASRVLDRTKKKIRKL